METKVTRGGLGSKLNERRLGAEKSEAEAYTVLVYVHLRHTHTPRAEISA